MVDEIFKETRAHQIENDKYWNNLLTGVMLLL